LSIFKYYAIFVTKTGPVSTVVTFCYSFFVYSMKQMINRANSAS